LVRVADAWRADVVLVETVGVGQDELEVTRTADTTLVVMAPGMGDDVQAIKAGILECADVFAVNKADRDGADATMRDLELMIALGQSIVVKKQPRGHALHGPAGKCGATASTGHVDSSGRWQPPVVRCIATRGDGVDALVDGMTLHYRWLTTTELGRERRMERLAEAMKNQLRQALFEHADSEMGEAIDEAVRRVADKAIDPYTAAEELVAKFRR
jgi:LAO/AO transport system kinase